jgi:hypothetical protein
MPRSTAGFPLSAANVQRMADILEPLAFDAIYGAFRAGGR